MEKSEKLILLVRNCPILYDFANEDFKNTKMRDRVWDGIAAELNESSEDAKKKWKNLRDTYLRFKKGKKKTGKRWHWAALLETFKPPLKFESRKGNLFGKKYEYSELETTDNKSTCDPIATESADEELYDDSIFVEFPRPSESLLPENSNPAPPPSSSKVSKKRKLKNEATLNSSMESLVKHLKKQEQPELDETDLLFLAYSRNIKTFSKKRQAIAKMKVCQVIMEQELENIEDQSPANQNHNVNFSITSCSDGIVVSRSGTNSPHHELIEYQDSKLGRDI